MTAPTDAAKRRAAKAKAKKRAEQIDRLKILAIGLAFGFLIAFLYFTHNYYMISK